MSDVESVTKTIAEALPLIRSGDGDASVASALDNRGEVAALENSGESGLGVQRKDQSGLESDGVHQSPQVSDKMDDASLSLNGDEGVNLEGEVAPEGSLESSQPFVVPVASEDAVNAVSTNGVPSGVHEANVADGDEVLSREAFLSAVEEEGPPPQTQTSEFPEKNTMHMAEASADRCILNEMELQSQVENDGDLATLEMPSGAPCDKEPDADISQELAKEESPKDNNDSTENSPADGSVARSHIVVEDVSKSRSEDTDPPVSTSKSTIEAANTHIDDEEETTTVVTETAEAAPRLESLAEEEGNVAEVPNPPGVDEEAFSHVVADVEIRPEPAVTEQLADGTSVNATVASEEPTQNSVETHTDTISQTDEQKDVAILDENVNLAHHDEKEDTTAVLIDGDAVVIDPNEQESPPPNHAQIEEGTMPLATVEQEASTVVEADISTETEPTVIESLSQFGDDFLKRESDPEMIIPDDDIPIATLDSSTGEVPIKSKEHDIIQPAVILPPVESDSVRDDNEDKPTPMEEQLPQDQIIPSESAPAAKAAVRDSESVITQEKDVNATAKEPDNGPAVFAEDTHPGLAGTTLEVDGKESEIEAQPIPVHDDLSAPTGLVPPTDEIGAVDADAQTVAVSLIAAGDGASESVVSEGDESSLTTRNHIPVEEDTSIIRKNDVSSSENLPDPTAKVAIQDSEATPAAPELETPVVDSAIYGSVIPDEDPAKIDSPEQDLLNVDQSVLQEVDTAIPEKVVEEVQDIDVKEVTEAAAPLVVKAEELHHTVETEDEAVSQQVSDDLMPNRDIVPLNEPVTTVGEVDSIMADVIPVEEPARVDTVVVTEDHVSVEGTPTNLIDNVMSERELLDRRLDGEATTVDDIPDPKPSIVDSMAEDTVLPICTTRVSEDEPVEDNLDIDQSKIKQSSMKPVDATLAADNEVSHHPLDFIAEAEAASKEVSDVTLTAINVEMQGSAVDGESVSLVEDEELPITIPETTTEPEIPVLINPPSEDTEALRKDDTSGDITEVTATVLSSPEVEQHIVDTVIEDTTLSITDSKVTVDTEFPTETLANVDKLTGTTEEPPTVEPGAPDDRKLDIDARAESLVTEAEEKSITEGGADVVPEAKTDVAEPTSEIVEVPQYDEDAPLATEEIRPHEEEPSASPLESTLLNGELVEVPVTVSDPLFQAPEPEMFVIELAAEESPVIERGGLNAESATETAPAAHPVNDTDGFAPLGQEPETETIARPETPQHLTTVAVEGRHVESEIVEEAVPTLSEPPSGAIPVPETSNAPEIECLPNETLLSEPEVLAHKIESGPLCEATASVSKEPAVSEKVHFEMTQSESALPRDDKKTSSQAEAYTSVELVAGEAAALAEHTVHREIQAEMTAQVYGDTEGDVRETHTASVEEDKTASYPLPVVYSGPAESKSAPASFHDDATQKPAYSEKATANEREITHGVGSSDNMAPTFENDQAMIEEPSADQLDLANTAKGQPDISAIVDSDLNAPGEDLPRNDLMPSDGSDFVAAEPESVDVESVVYDKTIPTPPAEVEFSREPDQSSAPEVGSPPEVITPKLTEDQDTLSEEAPTTLVEAERPKSPAVQPLVSPTADHLPAATQISSEHPAQSILNEEASAASQAPIDLPAESVSQDVSHQEIVTDEGHSIAVDTLATFPADADDHDAVVTPSPREDPMALRSLLSQFGDPQTIQQSVEIKPEFTDSPSVDFLSEISASQKPQLSVIADIPADDGRPKSPWTPSHSITVSGGALNGSAPGNQTETFTAEQIDESSKGAFDFQDHQHDTAIIEAPSEHIDKLSETVAPSVATEIQPKDFDYTDESTVAPKHISPELLTTPSGDPQVSQPERPKSPWAPSYSVTRQGSLPGDTLDSNHADREGHPRSIFADESVYLDKPIIPPSSEPTEVTEPHTTADSGSGVVASSEDFSSSAQNELTLNTNPVSGTTEPPPHTVPLDNPVDSPIRITVTSDSVKPEEPSRDVHSDVDRQQPDGPPIATYPVQESGTSEEEILGQDAIKIVGQDTKSTLQIDDSTQVPDNTGMHGVSGKSVKPAPLRLITVNKDGPTNVTQHTDTLSPPPLRKRHASTASSRFSGGWLSPTTKAEEGRTSMEIANGEFTPSKSPIEMTLAVPPPTPVVAVEQKKGRNCIIM